MGYFNAARHMIIVRASKVEITVKVSATNRWSARKTAFVRQARHNGDIIPWWTPTAENPEMDLQNIYKLLHMRSVLVTIWVRQMCLMLVITREK